MNKSKQAKKEVRPDRAKSLCHRTEVWIFLLQCIVYNSVVQNPNLSKKMGNRTQLYIGK